MSEAAIEGGNNSGETPAAEEFQPITSQDDLNRLIGERVKRATSKFADYKELQAKAEKLAEIEAANQTEAEKAQARVAELEQQAAQAQREALRFKVASKHGISDEDADLFLTGSDEETLMKQAERLVARHESANSARPPRPDANQGRSGAGGPTSTADSFAEFFRNNI